MTGEFSSTWLTLREPADAAARSAELAAMLRDRLEAPLVIRDLGCGTGSLARWLAPRLPGPQHWILHDRDPDLLARAGAGLPDGVTTETRRGDVTALTGDDLKGTSLVTCSALLDLLTAEEVESLAAACAVHGTPALFTLSVTGEVSFDPADPLDAEISAAFNAHQRREVDGRRLLGPDAAGVAATAFGTAGVAATAFGTAGAAGETADAFEGAGATVTLRPSPWRLDSDDPLAAVWLAGRLSAAQEQRPDLRLEDFRRRRATGRFSATVGHLDLLAAFD